MNDNLQRRLLVVRLYLLLWSLACFIIAFLSALSDLPMLISATFLALGFAFLFGNWMLQD